MPPGCGSLSYYPIYGPPCHAGRASRLGLALGDEGVCLFAGDATAHGPAKLAYVFDEMIHLLVWSSLEC